MRKYVTGHCPVHNEEVEIQVDYVTARSIGAPDTEKVDKFKCAVSDDTRSECSRCPIAFPSVQRP